MNARYKHNCAGCKYLGQHDDYDLYVHPALDLFIARFSGEHNDQISGVAGATHPALVEAQRLAQDPRAVLSARERQVLDLIAIGIPNRETARQLCISVRTVETHRANGMEKLALKTNADVVRLWTYIEMEREIA